MQYINIKQWIVSFGRFAALALAACSAWTIASAAQEEDAAAAQEDIESPTAIADFSAQALNAYNGGDFETARTYFEQACSGGDAVSCFNIAQMFYAGEGGSVDQKSARSRFKQSCDGGYAVGCYNYAVMLQQGQGAFAKKKEPLKALQYYKKSCDLGYNATETCSK